MAKKKAKTRYRPSFKFALGDTVYSIGWWHKQDPSGLASYTVAGPSRVQIVSRDNEGAWYMIRRADGGLAGGFSDREIFATKPEAESAAATLNAEWAKDRQKGIDNG